MPSNATPSSSWILSMSAKFDSMARKRPCDSNGASRARAAAIASGSRSRPVTWAPASRSASGRRRRACRRVCVVRRAADAAPRGLLRRAPARGTRNRSGWRAQVKDRWKMEDGRWKTTDRQRPAARVERRAFVHAGFRLTASGLSLPASSVVRSRSSPPALPTCSSAAQPASVASLGPDLMRRRREVRVAR